MPLQWGEVKLGDSKKKHDMLLHDNDQQSY